MAAGRDALAKMLEEAGWIRRLAGGLAAGDGDDVAQDAWLVALGSPPSTDEPVRPWFAAVIRRLAHTRRRSAARRQERERAEALAAAAVTAKDPGAADAGELLRVIGELVGELDEPYRSTILYRYYEGLSSSDISARLNVPAGTVRWRLKEAIAKLRARLDERTSGGRAAWMGLLVSLPASKLVAKGASPMIAALKLGAAASILIGGAVAVHFKTRPHASAPAVVVAQAAPAPAQHDDAPSLQAAQDAYVAGNFDEAIDLARKAMQAGAEPKKGFRIVGASNCFLKNAAGAHEAYDQLDPKGRTFIRYVCRNNEVELPDGKPVM